MVQASASTGSNIEHGIGPGSHQGMYSLFVCSDRKIAISEHSYEKPFTSVLSSLGMPKVDLSPHSVPPRFPDYAHPHSATRMCEHFA